MYHLDFPDYSDGELLAIAGLLLEALPIQRRPGSFEDYVARRRQLPFFANARSIRNAIDRARLRQANRLFARMGEALTRDDLITLEAADIRASRVFQGEVEGHHPEVIGG